MNETPIRQALILVGGRGTRLGEIARDLPKPMLPIAGGRSMLDYLLEMVERTATRISSCWRGIWGSGSPRLMMAGGSGPLAVSIDCENFKPPRIFRQKSVSPKGTSWPAEFIISSGSLLNLEIFDQVGPFREDFFIDAIDIEWCFRAWAWGYSCWIDSAISMPHRLGQGVIRVPLLDIRLTRQPPARIYSYVRNQMAILYLPHIPLRWKLRIFPYLMFQSAVYLITCPGIRGDIMRAFCYGFTDGLRSRLGADRRNCFN